MSTELTSVFGKIEIPNPKTKTSSYKNVEVSLNSFYGGIKRGQSLQITFENKEEGFSHVQLSNEEIIKFKKILEFF